MVDIGAKPTTARCARAEALIVLGSAAATALREATLAKGDALTVARIAGINAAKATGSLIPLCHPLPLDAVAIDFAWRDDATLAIEARVATRAATGVEMEALTAVTLAALTIYDMCKSIEPGASIGPVRLLEKSGGRSGEWSA